MKANLSVALLYMSVLQAGIGRVDAADSVSALFAAPMREVREVPRLNLGAISNTQTWALAQFMPRTPGKTPIVQIMRRDSNQKLVPVGSPEGPLAVGKLKIAALLTAQPKPSINSYKWVVPSEVQFFNGPRDLEREDRLAYSVFIDGGFAVCKIDLRQRGEARFSPAFPIPKVWQSEVVPAYKFYAAHRDLFSPTRISQTNQARLQSLIDNTNPLIAIAACQRLNEAGKLRARFVGSSLARAKGLRQAVFAYLLTRGTLKLSVSKTLVISSQPTYGVLETRADLAPQASLLVRSQTTSGLRSLALGVFASGVTEAYNPFEKKRTPFKGFGPALLRAIAQRTRALKISKPRNQDERDLLTLLRFAKLW